MELDQGDTQDIVFVLLYERLHEIFEVLSHVRFV